MTSAFEGQHARTIPALVKTMGQHHLTTRLSAFVSIKQNHAHNIPLPLYRHAIWWIIMERKDSGKRITELPDSLDSIIIHLVLMGRVYCTAIIPFSYQIKTENTYNKHLNKLPSVSRPQILTLCFIP